MLNYVKYIKLFYVIQHNLKNNMYFCIEFFMVLDFKVNVRLVVGMTINFFCLKSNYSI